MITDIAGWIGIALILGAYYLISNKRVDNENVYYQLMNLIGAALVGVNVYAQEAWPVFFTEIAWAGIAMRALVRIQRSRRTS